MPRREALARYFDYSMSAGDRRGRLVAWPHPSIGDRPTLVIASVESPLLEVQKEMAETISGARWVVVPDTGHALFIDAPERFDDELAQLLKVVAQSAR